MKWVKKGAYIRLCDDNIAAKLMGAGFEPFEPTKEAKPEEKPEEPKKKAGKKSE